MTATSVKADRPGSRPSGAARCAVPTAWTRLPRAGATASGRWMRCWPRSSPCYPTALIRSTSATPSSTCRGATRAPCAQALIEHGLHERVRWYTYASPIPFDYDLAVLLRRAGCVGINFGGDAGNPTMLQSLGRVFGVHTLVATADACRRAGLTFMYDLLLGGPRRDARDATGEYRADEAPGAGLRRRRNGRAPLPRHCHQSRFACCRGTAGWTRPIRTCMAC